MFGLSITFSKINNILEKNIITFLLESITFPEMSKKKREVH